MKFLNSEYPELITNNNNNNLEKASREQVGSTKKLPNQKSEFFTSSLPSVVEGRVAKILGDSIRLPL